MSASLAQVALFGSTSTEWVLVIAAATFAIRQVGWALIYMALTFVVIAGFFAPRCQGYVNQIVRTVGGIVAAPRHKRRWPARLNRRK